ncbi:MAG: exosortase C-terminal domain/associated protein EpsI [Candidatus Tectimicrobiota bacterium]
MKGSRRFFISLGLLLMAGFALRSLSHGEAVPPRENFTTFPLQVEQWTGRPLTLDTKVLEVLRVDDYILRQYRDERGVPIELYVGYYRSQRQGATYHSPKNCLPGSGWTFVKTGTANIQAVTPTAQPFDINQFVIQKGLDKQLVLYWYQDRGRIIRSEYWAKIYMVLDAIKRNRTDGAFVRITVPFGSEQEEQVAQRGQAFVEKIFPVLLNYLPS